MECHSQQPHFDRVRDLAADIQKRLGDELAVLEDVNGSTLLNNEEAVGSIRRLLNIQRLAEARNQRLEGDWPGRRGRRRRGRRNH